MAGEALLTHSLTVLLFGNQTHTQNFVGAILDKVNVLAEDLVDNHCLSFAQVDVQLEPPARVSLMPSLDDIQGCINKSAQAILGCFKQVRQTTKTECQWEI